MWIISLIKTTPEPSTGPEDINSLVAELVGPGASPQSPAKGGVQKTPQTTPTSAPGTHATPPQSVTTKQRKLNLVVDQLAPVNIRPKEVESYAKQTQTDVSSYEEAPGSEDEDTEVKEEPSYREVLGKTQNKEQEKQVSTANTHAHVGMCTCMYMYGLYILLFDM